MKKVIILWIIIGICWSCDDFLSKTQSDEVIPESTKSFSELLLNEGYLINNVCVDKMTYYMDDDVDNFWPESTLGAGYKEDHVRSKLFYTWQPNAVDQVLESVGSSYYNLNGYVPWKTYFERVLGCNLILEYVDGSFGTEIDKDYLKGQAYFLRAFYYFQMINIYAWPYNDKTTDPKTNPGVPLITKPEIGALVFPRNTVSEVYGLIVEDIEKGVEYLDKEKREATKYRVSYLAAHLLASRIYLYLEQWDKALEHASYVMERKELCDYTGLVAGDYETKPVFREGNDDILWLFGYRLSWWGSAKASSLSDAFVPSASLYASFDESGLTDKRKDYFLNLESNNLLSVVKYSSSSSNYGQGFRASEAYLNAIEALLMQYKEGNADAGSKGLKLLNEFRKKRYVSVDGIVSSEVETAGADVLLEVYKSERRKELCFEGQRWFDLRRFGMPRMERQWSVDGISQEKYILEKRDPMYVQDIPAVVMDLNPGIQPNESLSGPRMSISL